MACCTFLLTSLVIKFVNRFIGGIAKCPRRCHGCTTFLKQGCMLPFFIYRGLCVLINCIDVVLMFSQPEHMPWYLSKWDARTWSPSPNRTKIGAKSCKFIRWSPTYKLMQSTMRTRCLWGAMMPCCMAQHVVICLCGTKRLLESFAAWTMVKVRSHL